jgi:hypothetical protein
MDCAEWRDAMTTEPTLCAFCKEREAHPKSDEGFCVKCHFDIFDVNLEDDDGDDSLDMMFNDDWD